MRTLDSGAGLDRRFEEPDVRAAAGWPRVTFEVPPWHGSPPTVTYSGLPADTDAVRMIASDGMQRRIGLRKLRGNKL
jgi:hypothetical protein